jgi:hypothetical protein
VVRQNSPIDVESHGWINIIKLSETVSSSTFPQNKEWHHPRHLIWFPHFTQREKSVWWNRLIIAGHKVLDKDNHLSLEIWHLGVGRVESTTFRCGSVKKLQHGHLFQVFNEGLRWALIRNNSLCHTMWVLSWWRGNSGWCWLLFFCSCSGHNELTCSPSDGKQPHQVEVCIDARNVFITQKLILLQFLPVSDFVDRWGLELTKGHDNTDAVARPVDGKEAGGRRWRGGGIPRNTAANKVVANVTDWVITDAAADWAITHATADQVVANVTANRAISNATVDWVVAYATADRDVANAMADQVAANATANQVPADATTADQVAINSISPWVDTNATVVPNAANVVAACVVANADVAESLVDARADHHISVKSKL